MTTAVAPSALPEMAPEERALLTGDLSKLDAGQRATLVASVCRSLGLNPLTQPFAYITLNGKLTLYARKDATDQLRALRNVSVRIDSKEQIGDLYLVCVSAMLPSGRVDSEIGAVSTSGLRGEALANAMMKAITKAKRRATLSICGLGFLDETEVETIPSAQAWQEAPSVPVPAPRALLASGDGPRASIAPNGKDPNGPAPEKAYQECRELQAKLALAGERVEVPQGMTYGEAAALYLSLKSRVDDYDTPSDTGTSDIVF